MGNPPLTDQAKQKYNCKLVKSYWCLDLRQQSMKDTGSGVEDAKQLIAGGAGTIMTNG